MCFLCLGILFAAMTVACEKPRPSADKAVAIILTAGQGSAAFIDARRSVDELASRTPKGSITYVDPGKDLAGAIAGAAADPRVGAILVYPAPTGTAAAFSGLRSQRPELLLVAGRPEDDPLSIEAAADLVMAQDLPSIAWNLATAAKAGGAVALHVLALSGTEPSPTERDYAAALAVAAKRMDLGFSLDQAAPASVDALVASAGSRAAWAAASDSLAPPLAAACLKIGATYLGSSSPSPRLGIAEALGLSLPAGDAEALALLDKTCRNRGTGTRFHSWPRPVDGYLAAGLTELAARAIASRAASSASGDRPPASAGFDLIALDSIRFALRFAAPGVDARLDYRLDPLTGVRSRNSVLVNLADQTLGTGKAAARLEEPPLDYRAELGKAD